MRLAMALALLIGCRTHESTPADPAPAPAKYDAVGKRPVNPKRASPPPEIAASALAVGAVAPPVTLEGAAGAWSLAGELSKHARVMLVFYRGDW